MNDLINVYNALLDEYGHQGWWPIIDYNGSNPTKTGSIKGYHPKDYSFPVNDSQRFEICAGAILAQNTGWINVEKSLVNLKREGLLCAEKIVNSVLQVRELIKPSGYFNLKAGYLENFSRFYLKLNGRIPERKELLAVKGIGKETADSILLYAYKVPVFIVDAYTKRMFNFLGVIDSVDYENIRLFFEGNLPKDYELFEEFHALIVEHAKNFYSKKPYGAGDFLKKII
ncbi:MAG: endonuclease III domain-containing protein [Candidatus Nanoarchaeia archaeon]|nr:endonuclease III domain-containing protein [Candidatus Nanoarchaeia archaeon]MDD5499345.1 endonuclease III domain-containing protein [Candidatus Nanoarchaeia archaeon]